MSTKPSIPKLTLPLFAAASTAFSTCGHARCISNSYNSKFLRGLKVKLKVKLFSNFSYYLNVFQFTKWIRKKVLSIERWCYTLKHHQFMSHSKKNSAYHTIRMSMICPQILCLSKFLVRSCTFFMAVEVADARNSSLVIHWPCWYLSGQTTAFLSVRKTLYTLKC